MVPDWSCDLGYAMGQVTDQVVGEKRVPSFDWGFETGRVRWIDLEVDPEEEEGMNLQYKYTRAWLKIEND